MKARADNPFLLARKAGRREGAWGATIACTLIAAALMIGSYSALMMYADNKHESAMAAIKQADARALNKCKTDLADFSAIAKMAKMAKAYDERVAGR